jgi:hypothetical protein
VSVDAVVPDSPSEVIPPLQLGFLDALRDRRLDADARRIATGRLLQMARATPWPELACRALENVVAWEVEGRTEFTDPVDARLTSMLRRSETTCRCCLRPLPSANYLELRRFEAEMGAWERRLREREAS